MTWIEFLLGWIWLSIILALTLGPRLRDSIYEAIGNVEGE